MSDSYLGGILVGDDFSGGEEPPDWLSFVRASTSAAGQLRLQILLSSPIAAGASIHAYLDPLDKSNVQGKAAVTAKLIELFGLQGLVSIQAHATASMREILGQRGTASGRASISATLGLLPSMPAGIVQPRAAVTASLTTAAPSGLSIHGSASVHADATLGLVDVGHAVVHAAVSIHAGLTRVRHRTLLLFVTTGRSVDNSLEMELDSHVGSTTRQVTEPEPTRTQAASFA